MLYMEPRGFSFLPCSDVENLNFTVSALETNTGRNTTAASPDLWCDSIAREYMTFLLFYSTDSLLVLYKPFCIFENTLWSSTCVSVSSQERAAGAVSREGERKVK